MKKICIFAGPNGSGISTIVKNYIAESNCPELFICPDNFVAPEDKDKYEPYILAMQKAEAVRYQEIAVGHSFSFETVLSTEEKLGFIRYAKRQGYKIHTIYITTKTPEINIERVKQRVLQGGHDVPVDKIISRYEKSMQLMFDVIGESDTVEFFDNSGTEPIWIGIKINNGISNMINPPEWFKEYVIDKFNI
jgi:predicted ABC-type ATPase